MDLLKAFHPDRSRDCPTHEQIQEYLASRITSGELSEGTQLPSTLELSRIWRVDMNAVQRAMSGLKAAGMVRRIQRKGTFVEGAPSPPLVAVVCGFRMTEQGNYYHRSVVGALQEELEDRGWQVEVFDGLRQCAAGELLEQTRSLREMLDEKPGCNFLGFVGVGTSEVPVPTLTASYSRPAVRCSQVYDHADVTYDWYGFARDALERAASGGAKTVAALTAMYSGAGLQGLQDGIREYGLELDRAEALLLTSRQDMATSAHDITLRMIWEWQARGRVPDALLVFDDIAMQGVDAALLKGGFDKTVNPRVILAANAGIDHYYCRPVTRYLFSPRAMAIAGLDLLWRRTQGDRETALPCLIRGAFEDETSPSPDKNKEN